MKFLHKLKSNLPQGFQNFMNSNTFKTIAITIAVILGILFIVSLFAEKFNAFLSILLGVGLVIVAYYFKKTNYLNDTALKILACINGGWALFRTIPMWTQTQKSTYLIFGTLCEEVKHVGFTLSVGLTGFVGLGTYYGFRMLIADGYIAAIIGIQCIFPILALIMFIRSWFD